MDFLCANIFHILKSAGYNAAINVMPHPTQYGDGGDAVGI